MRRTKSLCKNTDFKHVYERGKNISNRIMALVTLPNGLEVNRLGITVSKKIGNSVVRSRVKRLIKEAYRLNELKMKTSFDYVFVARLPINGCNFWQIQESLLGLVQRQKLFLCDCENE